MLRYHTQPSPAASWHGQAAVGYDSWCVVWRHHPSHASARQAHMHARPLPPRGSLCGATARHNPPCLDSMDAPRPHEHSRAMGNMLWGVGGARGRRTTSAARHARCATRGATCPHVNMAKVASWGSKCPRMAVQHGATRLYVNIRRRFRARFGAKLTWEVSRRNFDRNFGRILTFGRIGRDFGVVC